LKEPLESEQERKRPGGDEASKPDSPRENIEKGRVISQASEGKFGELALKKGTVAFKDDPGLRHVCSREPTGGRKAPVRCGLVVGLRREERVQPFPENRVSRLDQHDATSELQYARCLTEKRRRVRQVMKDIQHEDRRDAVIRKLQPVRAHRAVQMRFRMKVGRHDFRKDLLEKTAARAKLQKNPIRYSLQVPRELTIVLSIEILQERFPFNQPPVNLHELG